MHYEIISVWIYCV